MTPFPEIRSRTIAVLAGAIASLASASCIVDSSEHVGQTQEPLGWYRNPNTVSPLGPTGLPEANASHTVSVAVSDNTNDVPPSDVVVAYERDGESWRSWGLLTSVNPPSTISWTRAGGGMPAPADAPTDSFAFGKYEGWSTVLAFQGSQSSPNTRGHTFLYVTKFGSVTNGSTVTSGSGGRFSTDVAVLRSTDGGVTFASGRRLTSPPPVGSGIARWKIEFPTAANNTTNGGNFLSQNYIVVAWKQTPVFTSGAEGTPEWKARFVWVDYAGDTDFVPRLSLDPFTLPVPGTSGPISISGEYPSTDTIRAAYPTQNTMQLSSDGVTWDASSRCPNPSATSVDNTWRYLTTSCTEGFGCGSTLSENIFQDGQFRICVGASRNAMTGTAWNKQLIQPRMVVDTVTKDVYVAITTNAGNAAARSRSRIYRKVGTNAFAQLFETTASTDGLLHDEWAPALSVYHYPGETADIFLSWRSTKFDTTSATKNEKINRLATRSGNAGSSWDTPGGWFMDNLVSPVAVQGWLGSYDGVMASPYVLEGFQAGWGDPRNPPNSKVYGATLYP